MEREFSVRLHDKPGGLARVSKVLREDGVNIRGIAVQPRADAVSIVTSNPEKTRRSLNRSNMKFSERNVLVAKLVDKPGELARFSEVLARDGINIDSAYMLDRDKTYVHLALGVDERKIRKTLDGYIDKKRKILRDYREEMHKIDRDVRRVIGMLSRNPDLPTIKAGAKIRDVVDVVGETMQSKSLSSEVASNLRMNLEYLKQAQKRMDDADELLKSELKDVDDLIEIYKRKLG